VPGRGSNAEWVRVVHFTGDDTTARPLPFGACRLEKENLRRALRQTRWKIYGPDGAAELLGVKPTTLVSRIKKLGLERESGQV